ncbi:Flp family type IVb pilin [Pseudonocardia sp. TMWB2A]|uniref:Flp family type IVb pilin n=1 Tax=Pseudonocardia sp. TMWB2A TaxID=687430 RepID=UPI00307EEA7E
MTKLLRLLRCERAATAVEYGLIAAIICLGALTAISAFADANGDMWATVQVKTVEATKS